MPHIKIQGVDHYYEWVTTEQAGLAEKPDANKPVLVFVHGWAGSARYWETTARALADEFNCLLYDMRGFGRSRLPNPVSPEVEALGYEMENYANDLALFLDALGLEQVYLNAHSMGASVATLFLNRYAERVKKAVLTCSGIFEYDEKAFKAFHRFGGYVVQFRPNWLVNIPFASRMFMARFLRRSLPNAICRSFMEDFLTADHAAALGTIFTSVSETAAKDMPQEFARIKVPTLLVAGEYDQIIPAAMGQQAAALSDQVSFVMIPETAHFPMLEDEETYLQHVRPFLKNTNSVH